MSLKLKLQPDSRIYLIGTYIHQKFHIHQFTILVKSGTFIYFISWVFTPQLNYKVVASGIFSNLYKTASLFKCGNLTILSSGNNLTYTEEIK